MVLVPILWLAYYNHPTGDDFWFVWMMKQYGYPQVVQQWSQTINARFTANSFMSFSTLVYGSVIGYKLFPVVLVVLLPISLFTALRSVLPPLFSQRQLAAVVVLFTCCYYQNMPGIYEGLYWMSGTVNYQLSLICFLFLSAAGIRKKKDIFSSIWAVFCSCFYSIGL